jgi:hypothetical protein
MEDSLEYSNDDFAGGSAALEESISIEEQLQRASSRQYLHKNHRHTAPSAAEDDSIAGYIERRLPSNPK